MSYKHILFFGGLLIVFTIFSLFISAGKVIWRDEAFTILLSQQSLETIIAVSSQDFTPPLFYFLLHYWQQFFGTAPVVARVIPLLFSLGVIILLYSFRTELFSVLKETKKTLLFDKKSLSFTSFYALIVTLNTVVLYFSTELRSYSMLMFLVLASAFIAYRLINQFKWFTFYLLVIVTTALIYTHNLGLVWLVNMGVGIFLFGLFRKKYHLWRWFGGAFFLTGLLYLPWFRFVIMQTQNMQESFWVVFNPWRSLTEYQGLFVINEQVKHFPFLYSYLAKVSLLIAGLGLWSVFSKYRKFQLFGILFLLVIVSFYIVSLAGNPILYQRYVSLLTPLAILWIAIGFISIKNYSKSIFLALAASYLLLSMAVMYDYSLGLSKTTYKDLRKIYNQVIYTDDAMEIMPCMYYHPHCTFVGNTQETPKYIGTAQLPSIPTIASWAAVKDPTIWVIYRKMLSNGATSSLAATHIPIGDSVALGDDVYLQKYWRKP